ncbi:MAG: hypothetical protein U1E48_10965 [Paracoccaceae bacterium]
MVEFAQAWLAAELPKGEMTEIRAVTALEGFRRATENTSRTSVFETICGAGPNGAIIHCRVSRATDRAFRDSRW